MKQPSDFAAIPAKPAVRWLNRTVVGIGLAALFSDWSHEIATTVMPAFLATMGVAAFWVGLIEGVSDGLSSFANLASGHCTNKLRQRKPVCVRWTVSVTEATGRRFYRLVNSRYAGHNLSTLLMFEINNKV